MSFPNPVLIMPDPPALLLLLHLFRHESGW